MSSAGSAEILVAALKDAGVRCVFGIPGTQTVDLFEALRRARLRTVLATSEQGAAFMAGGWARVTGQPGVVLTIPGPGFTWALTGVAEARLDSIPLLHITMMPPRGARRFQLQELDQRAIAAPLVKGVIEPSDAAAVRDSVAEALRLCTTGEPGPVLLQLPNPPTSERQAPSAESRAPSAEPPGSLQTLRARMAAARRPLLFAGQGALGNPEALRSFAEGLPAPVLTTPSARGVLPEDHPMALGFDGLGGDVEQLNSLLDSCDLILVLGAKLSHNGTSGYQLRLPRERLVHIDASPAVLGANYPASLEIVGDVPAVLGQLTSHLLPLTSHREGTDWTPQAVADWRARFRSALRVVPEPRVAGTPDRSPKAFFEELRRALPREAILVLDSGLHQVLARRYFPVLEPRSLLFPSDLQSMGFGIPTAVGAKLAAPARPVVALVGDGGFAMTGLELLSGARERLDLTVLVFSDGQLGQIRAQQLAEYGAAHAVALHNPDFGLFAGAVGAGYSVADENIGTLVQDAVRRGGLSLIEVPVGDSPRLRLAAVRARSRASVRQMLGARMSAWIRRVLRRTPDSPV
ncbi:MAG: thiamine pyrophosphate-binding protein [Gemmatimonadales bacterium]